uniref:Transglutaminase-like domain-containing protein n=1 Tax=Kalanchoe fedtschenkoi TaxID=63787 RepID=A0A7N0T4Q8_KALFE
MVSRNLTVIHNGETLQLEYDTDDGLEVLKFQLFSLTSIAPDHQKIVSAEDDRLVIHDDYDLDSFCRDLRLLSVDEEPRQSASQADFTQSDEQLARMLQAEEEALMLQQYVAPANNGQQMEDRLRPYITQVLMYEDTNRQEAAKKTVPVDQLEEKAMVALAKEGNFAPSTSEQKHAFLLQLLFWFKNSFSWVNAPACAFCGSQTVNQGMGVALPSESAYGASRIELYRCSNCLRETRFPRYNDPLKLLETRKGRCGEWANCFTLYCRAFGYESRLIMDFTDHVWTECFSTVLGRWMHLDPCEGVYDNPLLYEKGWKKKLNYVIAIARDGIYDVTKRYTKTWPEVLSRRNITTEPQLCSLLDNLTKECRKGFTPELRSILSDRDRKETDELERSFYSLDDPTMSLPGRQSGAKEWRISRAEVDANDPNSFSSTSCPVRKCIDEHVSRIYNAFYQVVSQFVDRSLSKLRALEILEVLNSVLKDLSRLPFQVRRLSINKVSNTSSIFLGQEGSSINQLLNSLSLKSQLQEDGTVDIYLAGDPVNTSLSLPVATDTIDQILKDLKLCDKLSTTSLSFPLLSLNRIHSGSVLASREELPFGISTSAFDGTLTTKWEDPCGATGSWLVYSSCERRMHILEAYQLMSANDAPERDPMDWVLEGSDDGGSSWNVIDKQSSCVFQNRIQRKTFRLASPARPSNAFRFRFLAVRDATDNGRLQIGSIDLYEKSPDKQ